MNEKICTWCNNPFTPGHFNQKLCSPECKTASIKDVKKRYKLTEKGKLTNERWIKSERRKENERRYQTSPKGKERAIKISKRYKENHPEKVKEISRKCANSYRKTPHGKDVHRKAAKAYRKTDKGKTMMKKHKYKARNPNATGFDIAAWNEKLKACGGKCIQCGTKEDITVDHIIPLSKGGSNHISNLQPLCRSCNSKKYNIIGGINLECNLLMWA